MTETAALSIMGILLETTPPLYYPMAFKPAHAFYNRTLAGYRSRLDQQQRLLAAIRNALPGRLSPHVLHCVADQGKLRLYTDSAAWASQLRFMKQEILLAANRAQPDGISNLQIRILADLLREGEGPEPRPNLPSAEKIAYLKQQADASGDDRLQQALQRLSATLAKLADGQ